MKKECTAKNLIFLQQVTKLKKIPQRLVAKESSISCDEDNCIALSFYFSPNLTSGSAKKIITS
jgi:hypothetical protein